MLTEKQAGKVADKLKVHEALKTENKRLIKLIIEQALKGK